MPGKWGVMYMYHARKVRSDVYVPCQESEGWCICVKNINMYHARKVRGHLYVLGISICTIPGKWGVMYMYPNTYTWPSLSRHGTYTWLLTFLAWYIYMTPHFPGMVHIDIPNTYTSPLTFLAWYILIFLTHINMYHARKVRGHVYVLGISICTMPGKWGVMYMR
jgi:hypothetical protein